MYPVWEKTDRLIGLLEENLCSYEILLELAEEIYGEMRRGTVEGAAEKMARREQLQKEISTRDHRIAEIRADFADALPDRGIADLVDKTVAVLTIIQALDRKTGRLMEEGRERLRRDLEELQQWRKAAQRYERYKGRGKKYPRFLDRCG